MHANSVQNNLIYILYFLMFLRRQAKQTAPMTYHGVHRALVTQDTPQMGYQVHTVKLLALSMKKKLS